MMFRLFRIAVLPLLFVALVASSCRQFPAPEAALPTPLYAPMIEPAQSAIFTATREVRALDFDGQSVWAATAGGVLRWQNGKLTKWTRREGLPSNEAFDWERADGKLWARFPTACARLDGAKWETQSAPEWKRRAPSALWNGQTVTADLDGLQIGDKTVTLPAQSGGTHISALLARGQVLLVAIYGDGLWRFDGKIWTRGPQVPGEAREIPALAGDEKTLWIGTRRDGIFQSLANGKWTNLAIPSDEPFGHNVQNLAEFDGVLWASTLDDSLIARTGKGWRHVTTPQISSSAPRQMRVWGNRLYVRHGGGIVDAFDGASWQKDVFQNIPRRGVYALAGNEKHLLAAGWGGWSEWDGAKWTGFYDLPGLKGVPVMNLALDGEDVWIGTQSRGLAKWTRKTGELRFFDERDGLSDDWITALLVDGPRVWAGTFVGGLQVYENGKWRAFESTHSDNVTAIASDGKGGVWATTRHGLFHADASGAEKVGESWLDEEGQALCAGENGLWVGTRTSLNFWEHQRN